MLREELLGLPLGNPKEERVRRSLGGEVDVRESLASPIEVATMNPSAAHVDSRPDAYVVEHLHRSRRHHRGLRPDLRSLVLVDDPARDTVPMELAGERQTDGTSTNDEDLYELSHVPSFNAPSGCRPAFGRT